MTNSGTNDKDDRSQLRGQQSLLASQRAKQNSHPSVENRTGRMGGYFTLGYKEGFSQWWANIPAAVAEHRVMSYIPYLRQPPTQTQLEDIQPLQRHLPTVTPNDNDATPVTTSSATDPHGPRQWSSNLINLSGKNRALNEFSIERIGEKHNQSLVMLHGYGAGLGFFYKNFEGLSRVKGWKVYALDLLGMGRSSRPPFRVLAKDRDASVTEAENWFIDALEEWRIQKNIDRFTLLGHSLGGYMAVAYALKYPGHLNKLVLASPVGIPEDPYAVNSFAPEPPDSTLTNEFTQDQAEVVSASNSKIFDSGKHGDNNNFLNSRSRNENSDKTRNITSALAPRKPLPKWLTYLWDANISPFSLVRWTGPLGPRFVSGWTSRRFSHLPPDEAQALHDYAYSLFRLRGSGEYVLAYVLAPGAFARSPLIRRIHGVGRQMISQPGSAGSNTEVSNPRQESGFPVVFMYGENDWMDIAGGYAAEQKMKEEKEKSLHHASVEDRKNDQGSAKVVIIRKAGHHVYLDGWEEFNAIMREEMSEVSMRENQ